jgi:hypothetical protein
MKPVRLLAMKLQKSWMVIFSVVREAARHKAYNSGYHSKTVQKVPNHGEF